MDAEPEPPPTIDATLATALGLMDAAIERVPQFAGAWSVVRGAVTKAQPAAAAKAANLETEARAVLERYAGVIAGLEPSIDSAVGIGIAAAGALVHLTTLGVAALARIAGDVETAERTLATAPEMGER